MQLEEFWQLIDQSQKKKHIPRLQIRFLNQCLSQRSVDDIIDFYHIFKHLLQHAELVSLRLAAGIIGDGIGSDGFWDFKGWLIAQGKDIYCAVIQNPEVLVDYVSLEKRQEIKYEGFGYIGLKAYRIKTGIEEIERDTLWDAEPRVQESAILIKAYPRDTNTYYDKEEAEIFPKLWAKFPEELFE